MKKIFSHIDLKQPSVISLLVFNLIIMVLAIIFQWSVSEMVILYWVENLIIGFYNIIKMYMARGTMKPIESTTRINDHEVAMKTLSGPAARTMLTFFFMVHYYGFCVGHGIFVFNFFGKEAFIDGYSALYLGVICLFISHGISILFNYIRPKKYLETNVAKQMLKPYIRIVFVHIYIFIGGAVAGLFGADSWVMIIPFIGLKIFIDLISHTLEHHFGKIAKKEEADAPKAEAA